jgi:hypothetical protein
LVVLTASKLAGLMAEPHRRRVAAALILSSGDLTHVVSATGLDHRQAVRALDRLVSAGLIVVGSDGVYVLLEEVFSLAARASRQPPPPAGVVPAASPDERVVEGSIRDGRLVRLPRKRSKRLVVLNHLAQVFEPGVHYSERDVNVALRAFDEDVAALRRHLVDEGFLDRSGGSYWRSGGSVDLGSATSTACPGG